MRSDDERRGREKQPQKNKGNPALTLLHQQDGHSDQHSPVQRVLHVCSCILAQSFIVVVGEENTACDSPKILKSASSPFFLLQLRGPTDWLAGWLADWRLQHPPTLRATKVPPSAARDASRRCARQASGTEGDITSGLPARDPRRTYFEEPHFLPCQGSTTANLDLLSAAATRGGAAVHTCLGVTADENEIKGKDMLYFILFIFSYKHRIYG